MSQATGGYMKFLCYDELKKSKGIRFSRPWLWRLEKRGDFPKRTYLGEKTIAWNEREIDEWMANRGRVTVGPAFPIKKKRGAA